MELPEIVKRENNPEVLKAFFSHIFNDIINDNEKLRRKINTLLKERAKQSQRTFDFEDELCVLRKRMFGRSSEKRVGSGRLRDHSKKPLSVHATSLVPGPDEKEMEKLLEIKVDHELSPEKLSEIAIEYGYSKDSQWECLTNFYDESEEIDIRVESYVRKKHRRFKYRLKASRKTEKEVIVTAPGPLKIMPGAKYSMDFSVDVVMKKYLYHLPLERIRRMMESGGLSVATKTLYGLCFFVHCYLEDMAERIREEILSCGLCVHLDESPWPIGNSKQSDGYLWVMSNQGGSYYRFEPTRSGQIAKELLGPYGGPVVVDGYGGYKSGLKENHGVVLSFCWSHVRRKFTDIEGNYPGPCSEILDKIGRLFEIERRASDYESLEKLREEESVPLIKEIKDWLFDKRPQARGESHLLKAIDYTLNHWGGLTLFLKNVRIPLSNNEAERTIRHSVMGRKNFYGSRTINGADVAATLYTVIESCKKVELDPRFYIQMVVRKKISKEKNIPTPLQYAKQIRKKSKGV